MAEFSDYLPDPTADEHPPDAPAELARRPGPSLTGLPTGTGLGKYRILERIRTYHNAVVYKARDTMLDRLVALKQMSPDLMDNPTACGNFKKEAQLLARVPKDARHVLNVHELIEDEIGLFIVEEYINGDWLEALITKRRIGPDDGYRLLRTACIGLRDLHSQKIVHRDINPGNIIIIKGAQAKIANFYSAAQEGDIATPPVITPKYSAPELLLEKVYDDRLDIYSLGMVVYEVCVGRLAFEQFFSNIVDSQIPVAGWIKWQTDLKKTLPDPALLNPRISPGLASVLRQMTAKRLEERFTCVEEVLAALARHAGAPPRIHHGIRDARTQTFFGPGRIAEPLPRPPLRQAAQPIDDLRSSTQRLQSRTSTHTVRAPAGRSSPDQRLPPRAEPRTSDRARVARPDSRRVARMVPPVMPRTMPAPILPRAARRPARRKRHSVVGRTMVAIFLITLGAGGYFTLDWALQHTPAHPIDGIFAKALFAYDQNDLAGAHKLFAEAAAQNVTHPQHQLKRAEAERWQLMVDAKEAINHDDFDRAQHLLQDVERQGGVSPSKRNELQQQLWSKQDAYKLAAQGYDNIRDGNFQSAELKLDEYEKKATAAGIDPGALKEKLSLSRKQKEYKEWLKVAEDALARKEFYKASTACNSAESFLVTTDTRELHKRILDSQKQADHIALGDKLMLSGEFNEAQAEYDEANRLIATPEIETKLRSARAHVLLIEAKDAIARGDLLTGEDKLNSSIWNSPLFEAQVKIEKMRPAFEAAQIVRNGDRAADLEDFKEAKRLYEQAMPQLPPPADLIVRKKIDEIHRREAVMLGQKAFKREDWLEAIRQFELAQKLTFDAEVEDLLVRAKAKLP